jgi:plastocyanin
MTRRTVPLLGGLLLLVAACGGGGATSAPTAADPGGGASAAPSAAASAAGACSTSTEAATVTVEIRQRAYIPGRVEAAVGDVIAFENFDGAPHTATLEDGTCTTENLGQGASGALTFTAPGEYPFFCRIHPDMTGTIVIG